MLDPALVVVLASAVFGASLFQAATGMGYGLLAGPALLILLGSADALQVSIVHNLIIAVLLLTRVWRSADHRMIRSLLIGSAMGLPVGFFIFTVTSVSLLKFFAAIVVALALLFTIAGQRAPVGRPPANRARGWQALGVAVGSGVLGGALAMPGPLATAWMSARGWSKETVRSTILVFFLFASASVLAMHVVFAGVTDATWFLTLWLSPVLVTGVVTGHLLTRFVSELMFRVLLRLSLGATVIALIATI